MTTRAARRFAPARAARLGLGIALVAGSLAAASAWAADPPQRRTTLLWREAATFLELTATQRQALDALQVAYSGRLQALRELQAQARAKSPDTGLCQQATAARAEWLAGSRAVLAPAQLARLAQLEAAFALMPVIESAQAAGLLDDRVALPPRGLPDGQASQSVSWLRVPAGTLPGCPAAATTVVPEVERDAPDAAATRPRR